jgi:hypothetical protein
MTLSDAIAFSGILVPGSAPGTFVIQLTSCSLKSDTERTAVNCQGSGQVTQSPPSGQLVVGSSDGEIQSNFTLKTTIVPNTYALKGSAIETDAPEGGVQPPPYSSIVKGKVTINTTVSPATITGTVKVLESLTSP